MHETIWVEGWGGRHSQDITCADIHNNDGTTSCWALDVAQSSFGLLLYPQVNCQHHIVSRLGLGPDVLGLPITYVVDQNRLSACRSPQFFIKPVFNAEISSIIRHTVGKERL